MHSERVERGHTSLHMQIERRNRSIQEKWVGVKVLCHERERAGGGLFDLKQSDKKRGERPNRRLEQRQK